jgi:hypothetical protein
MQKFILSVAIACLMGISVNGSAQAAAYFDPAQAYVKLLLDKDASSTVRIGGYKVVGTPFLFGEKHIGNIFTKDGNALNIQLSYNTYTQQVDVYNAGADIAIIKELASVDSFLLKGNKGGPMENDLHFVNAATTSSTEKAFFQIVYQGSKYILYKKYKSELGYVSTNYVQSELRQFDLSFEFFYTNVATKTTKKLKLNSYSVKKEFKSQAGIDELINDEAFSNNPEFSLIQLFTVMNAQ